MQVNVVTEEPVPPPIKVVVEMTADEARKLRVIMGSNSKSAYEDLLRRAGIYAENAFPAFKDYQNFTADLYHTISEHEDLWQPRLNNANDRPY